MKSLVLASVLLAGCPAPQSSSDLDARIKKLETAVAKLDKYSDALEFLAEAYEAQLEPDPTVKFAVDITPALNASQVEGSANALVTIVEAWDFA